MKAAKRFPQSLMNLDNEFDMEEDSDWCDRRLGSTTSPDQEEEWRSKIQRMIDEDTVPGYVYSEKLFLGGKQFQRAFALLKATMSGASIVFLYPVFPLCFRHFRFELLIYFCISFPSLESFPDLSEMKEYVASGAGYLQGGLQRENWEHATLSLVKMTSKTAYHPGINFFIKHSGSIFCHLFDVALQEVKCNSFNANSLIELCPEMEDHLAVKFDDMLWSLMEHAANNTHLALEPWYSCLNPNLPSFHPIDDEGDESEHYKMIGSDYVRVPRKSELREQIMKEKDTLFSKFTSMFKTTLDDSKIKELLRSRGEDLATERKSFLPEERSKMINEEETEKILQSAFLYVMALHEQIQIHLNFQINHYVYNAFKEANTHFSREVTDGDWDEMVPRDFDLEDNIKELEEKITEIQNSLREV